MPDAPLPKPRGAGAAAWDGKRIVFAGGNVGSPMGEHKKTGPSPNGNVWALRPGGSWTRVDGGMLQQPRDHLAAATDGTLAGAYRRPPGEESEDAMQRTTE